MLACIRGGVRLLHHHPVREAVAAAGPDGRLLPFGQLLWFQLFMEMEILMHVMQHVMASYMLVKVTLITAILVLAGPARCLTYRRG